MKLKANKIKTRANTVHWVLGLNWSCVCAVDHLRAACVFVVFYYPVQRDDSVSPLYLSIQTTGKSSFIR